MDGDAPEAESIWTAPSERAENQNLIWTGPYQPGGKDATDVVNTSWPEELYDRASARLMGFTPEEKAARKAYQRGEVAKAHARRGR